jgi:hypothetical protein
VVAAPTAEATAAPLAPSLPEEGVQPGYGAVMDGGTAAEVVGTNGATPGQAANNRGVAIGVSFGILGMCLVVCPLI